MTIPSVPTKGRTLDYAAPVYDLLEPLCLLNKQAVYDQTLLQALTPQPGDTILDLGCGTGLLCQKISALLDPAQGGSVTGIDAAGTMIEAAREKRGAPTAASRPWPQNSFHLKTAPLTRSSPACSTTTSPLS